MSPISILDFIGAHDEGGGGDNWSYKTCKAPFKSSPPTHQQQTFLQPECPSCCPAKCHSTERRAYLQRLEGKLVLSLAVFQGRLMWDWSMTMTRDSTATCIAGIILQQHPEWFDSLVPAYPGCHGNWPLKWLLLLVLCWILALMFK